MVSGRIPITRAYVAVSSASSSRFLAVEEGLALRTWMSGMVKSRIDRFASMSKPTLPAQLAV